MMKTPGAIEFPSPLANRIRSWVRDEHAAHRRQDVINGLRDLLHELSDQAAMPVDLVRWVPMDRVTPNDYNPNHVARVEMTLLLRSIMHDGYTQPIVTVWNPEKRGGVCTSCLPNDTGAVDPDCPLCDGHGSITGMFEIVDGFHRYFVLRSNEELRQRCHRRLPVVVIEKDINDRMASTIRHNRARGKHSVTGMANMVFQMLDNGMDDASVCNELGMEAEELLRLKHITGFSKLFKDSVYNRAWQTKNMIRLRRAQDATSAKSPAGGTDADTQAPIDKVAAAATVGEEPVDGGSVGQ